MQRPTIHSALAARRQPVTPLAREANLRTSLALERWHAFDAAATQAIR